jgi:hypothetical protein
VKFYFLRGSWGVSGGFLGLLRPLKIIQLNFEEKFLRIKFCFVNSFTWAPHKIFARLI